MIGNEVVSHLLFTFVYFIFVSLFKGFDLNIIWLWLGALLGTFLLDLDHLVYWFLTHPEKEDSIQARQFYKAKNYKALYGLLQGWHHTHTRLVFHTATFQVILFVLAFYIISAGGSIFGSALIMSVNLHLLKDEWFDYFKKGKAGLIDWLFWQVRGVPKERYLDIYLLGATTLFLVLTIFWL
ncbi:hypothetical protein C4578_04260 [Candidatus Microgenomates bacterium]|jgi:hypothetical protein|nr:MAG: hypothetical protein C4578_04260 [Candidatus Microgenomates bacterium]